MSERGLKMMVATSGRSPVSNPRVGDRLILRGPIVATSWTGRESEHRAVASATVEEVLARSVRVRIDSVSGVPRSWRKETAELMEGWHSLDELFPLATAPQSPPASDVANPDAAGGV